jgi:toxin-antitoxin system PIN domain toxin
MAGDELIGLSWMVALAFIRIATSNQVFSVPMTSDEAIETVAGWMQQDIVEVLNPGDRHLVFLSEQMMAGQARGALTMDAHLAALAQERGASICSFDRDFRRFPGVRLVSP